MENPTVFELQDFLPYLLDQAAEQTGQGFQELYKKRFGMLRAEWRVVFHLGSFGEITASEICSRANLHKTKVSRAVAALEKLGLLSRTQLPNDRRHEILTLTDSGEDLFRSMTALAKKYNAELISGLPNRDVRAFERCLAILAEKSKPSDA